MARHELRFKPSVAKDLRGLPKQDVQRICGHSDIAPGRKTDPGPAFDWSRLRRALAPQTGDL